MPGCFFQRFGFRQVQRDGNSILMLKNYGTAKPPEFILPQRKSTLKPGRVTTGLFWSGQCPYSWWVKTLTEEEFGKSGNLELSFVNTDNRKTLEKSTITFGLRIDGKVIYNRMPSWDIENPAGGGEVKKVLKSVPSV